jgi:hypothetical protein
MFLIHGVLLNFVDFWKNLLYKLKNGVWQLIKVRAGLFKWDSKGIVEEKS